MVLEICQYSYLSNYPKLLYATELTTFPYQMNSHQIFIHGHF